MRTIYPPREWTGTEKLFVIIGGSAMLVTVPYLKKGISKLIASHTLYDKDGFDPQGFNRDGFDRNGFNREGFDRFGRDVEGYDKHGFARDGFNRDGFDYEGYGRDGYNHSGADRSGCNKQFYSDRIKELRDRLREAKLQMKYGGYRYALYDARTVLEETLKLIVQHIEGEIALGDSLFDNLKICERKRQLDIEFFDKLHDVRKICNVNEHEFASDEQLSHGKVHFVIMQVQDLLNEAETLLIKN